MGSKYRIYNDDQYIEHGYKLNQYEDSVENGHFIYKQQVEARYIIPQNPKYQGNMLIEALPPRYPIEFVIKLLEKRPIYHDSERNKDELYREEAIFRLTDAVFCFSNYVEIEKLLANTIRNGYENRYVMTKEFIEKMNLNASILRSKEKNRLDKIVSIANPISTSSAGFSIFGISGGGKTTALNNLLSLYPQCINHTCYGGSKFLFRQVVYVKIDCSHNGSLKGICKKFFNEVDSILNTDYYSKFGNRRNSLDDMIVDMAYMTQLHAIGAIIIDEIQHLSGAKNGGEQILNFFVTLQNELHVPIIFCGTYKAQSKVFNQDLRQARRVSGLGEIKWTPMKNDIEYKKFMQRMWKYQWTKYKTELTDELLNVIYECTMGITDRIIKLFMAVQLEAMLSREERITKALIKKVFKEKMSLTKPMILALKSEDPNLIAQYDDLYAIDEYKIKNEYSSLLENMKKLEEIYKSQSYKREIKKEEIHNEIYLFLLELGVNQKEAEKIAKDTLKKHSRNKNVAILKQEAVKNFLNKQNEEEKQRENINQHKKINHKKNEITNGYEKLKKEGKIKSDMS